jgi:hypothetical protein
MPRKGYLKPAQREKKMEKVCPFVLPKTAIKFEKEMIKFEKEIDKFLVVKASENLMAAGRRGVGTSLLLLAKKTPTEIL